jgi:anthranilate/para-aminobenzoate synthase component II
MILVIDNYDSFVHNVTRYLRELGADAQVKRNDALTTSTIKRNERHCDLAGALHAARGRHFA